VKGNLTDAEREIADKAYREGVQELRAQERLWKAKGRVDMPIKSRVGSECKMVNCVRYKYYSAWAKNLGRSALNYCMKCKHAHVSQYERKEG